MKTDILVTALNDCDVLARLRIKELRKGRSLDYYID